MKLLLALLSAFQMGITQSQEIPADGNSLKQIESKLIRDYGLDTLDLHLMVLPDDSSYVQLGIYIPWSDSLLFNYHLILKTAEKYSQNRDSLITRIMKHELAHYEVDKLMEKHNLKSALEDPYSRNLFEVYVDFLFLNRSKEEISSFMLHKFVDMKRKELTTILLDKTINEGIGSYHEDPNREFAVVTWPLTIDSISNDKECNKFIMDNGSSLMYPIIKNHGWEGIRYVLKHMPTIDDFSNLLGYQKRILEELENKK